MSFTSRIPCPDCKTTDAVIECRKGQDCVLCATCKKFLYNAPRTETGRAQRSVTTVHNGVKPNQKARVLLRATGHCELCGASGVCLHVGHLLSVKDGLRWGLTELELNSDENLVAMCEECNLGLGEQTVLLRLAVAIVLARVRRVIPS